MGSVRDLGRLFNGIRDSMEKPRSGDLRPSKERGENTRAFDRVTGTLQETMEAF